MSAAKPDMDVMDVILHALSTADMILMTMGGLVSFYFDLLVQELTLKSHTGQLV